MWKMELNESGEKHENGEEEKFKSLKMLRMNAIDDLLKNSIIIFLKISK